MIICLMLLFGLLVPNAGVTIYDTTAPDFSISAPSYKVLWARDALDPSVNVQTVQIGTENQGSVRITRFMAKDSAGNKRTRTIVELRYTEVDCQ